MRLLCSLSLWIALPLLSRAATVYPVQASYVRLYDCWLDGLCPQVFQIESLDPDAPATLFGNFRNGLAVLSVAANTGYSGGSLRALILGISTGAFNYSKVTASAITTEIDRWRLESPGMEGETGYLSVTYSLHANKSRSNGNVLPSVGVLASTRGSTNSSSRQFFTTPVEDISGTFSLPAPLKFVFGEWFDFDFELGTFLSFQGGDAFGTVNAFQSLRLENIQVFDSTMQPVESASGIALSGRIIPILNPVPETSSLFLTSLGLLAVGLKLKR